MAQLWRKKVSGESFLGGWHDVPIRVTVIGKVKELMPNRKTALVEVSGAKFVASFDSVSSIGLCVGSEVLVDEEYAAIVGVAPGSNGEIL
jgi:hypothetical protein